MEKEDIVYLVFVCLLCILFLCLGIFVGKQIDNEKSNYCIFCNECIKDGEI